MANIVKSVLSPSKPNRDHNEVLEQKSGLERVQPQEIAKTTPLAKETQEEERLTYDEWSRRVQSMQTTVNPQDRVAHNLPRFTTTDWRECRTLVPGKWMYLLVFNTCRTQYLWNTKTKDAWHPNAKRYPSSSSCTIEIHSYAKPTLFRYPRTSNVFYT